MFDYRIFYPQVGIDEQSRVRRPLQGHRPERVYQLPPERRSDRTIAGRR